MNRLTHRKVWDCARPLAPLFARLSGSAGLRPGAFPIVASINAPGRRPALRLSRSWPLCAILRLSKLSVLCAMMIGSQLGHAAPATFRAGAAMVDITPTNFPIRTAGNLTLTIANKALD